MLERYAGNMFDVLKPFLPDGWDRLVLFGQMENRTYDFTFYVRQGEGARYRQCFDMAREGQYPRAELLKAFSRLYDLCRKAKKELAEQEPGVRAWTRFILVLNSEGRFTIDYEYGDMQLGVPQAWKDRYLV